MKALRTHEVGGPDTLTLDEVETPTPGKGQVLVDVKACAINYPDTLMIRDLYQFKPERPYAPGGEISGVIAELGEGVCGWKVGDRVIAMLGNGGLAEQVAVEAARLFAIPDGVDFPTAASILMTYGTTIHGLKDRGDIAEGQTVLVLGAAGGVGLSAVELAKAYGARVVAAVSSEEKAEVARKAGADEVVIYPTGDIDKDASKELAGQFKVAVGPQGADIVYDIVGGPIRNRRCDRSRHAYTLERATSQTRHTRARPYYLREEIDAWRPITSISSQRKGSLPPWRGCARRVARCPSSARQLRL